jgi:hypothetical protein
MTRRVPPRVMIGICGVVIPALMLIGTFFAVALPLAMMRFNFTVIPAALWFSGWLAVVCLGGSLVAPSSGRSGRILLVGLAFAVLGFGAAALFYFIQRDGPFSLNPPALLPLVICLAAIGLGAAAVGFWFYANLLRRPMSPQPTTILAADASTHVRSVDLGIVRPSVGLFVSLLPVLFIGVVLPGGLLLAPVYWGLFAVPAYALLRAKRWLHAWQAALMGFLVGFLPWVTQGLVTTGADSARIGSCVTEVGGITTVCGHWLNVKFGLPFGVIGAIAALACWAVDLRVRKRRVAQLRRTN